MIIAICGNSEVGKTTIEKEFLREFVKRETTGSFARNPKSMPPTRIITQAFADPLKNTIVQLFCGEVTREELDDPKVKASEIPAEWIGKGKSIKTWRDLLQTFGTEWVRDQINEDFWTIAWRKALENKLCFDEHCITSDIRFVNEIKAVREFYEKAKLTYEDPNTVVILVRRPSAEKKGGKKHKSLQLEESLKNAQARFHPDIFVDNDGTLEDLLLFARNVLPDVIEVCKRRTPLMSDAIRISCKDIANKLRDDKDNGRD